MALLGYSDDFDLDDDGILRDTGGSSGLFLDEDGIIRDDTDIYNQVTQWTDSGLGGDKRSSTSTLKHFDFPASFEEDPHHFDDRSLNISELEASRDFTFDASYVSADDPDFNDLRNSGNLAEFNQTLNFQETDDLHTTGSSHVDLFNEEYYQQLKDLGVLVDGADLSLPRQSLVEFESLEAELKAAGHQSGKAPYAEYLKHDEPRQIPGQSFPLRSEQYLSEEDLTAGRKYSRGGQRNLPDAEEDLDGSRPGSRARSDRTDRTVSSRSFPEVSPEEALELFNSSRHDRNELPSNDIQDIPLVDNDAESIEFDDSHKDEVKAILRSNEKPRPPTPTRITQHSNRPRSRSPPVARNRRKESPPRHTSGRSLTPVNKSKSPKRVRKQQEREQRTATPDSVKSGKHRGSSRPGSDTRSELHQRKRHDSSGSQLSTTSEIVHLSQASPATQNRRPNSQRSLGKARSEESFFDLSASDKSEKQTKRILPKPNMTPDQNFKLKSKSTTNISSRPGPVKPTHMSLAEITSLMIDDADDGQSEALSLNSDRSKGELKARLNQESSQRKQATELVHQLQKDYDSLLSKYALAELTIDQLRLGAKITLHSDSPTPGQAYSGTLAPAQQPLVSNVLASSRGLVTSSPAPGKSGHFSPIPGSEGPDYTGRKMSSSGVQTSNLRNSLPADSAGTEAGGQDGDDNPSLLASIGMEHVSATLSMQIRSVDERAESFNTLLAENHLSVDQQEKVFEKLKTDHDKLRRDYLQAKEDYDVLRRTSGTETTFDENKELEGELFRLGMKFDDIHEKVENNVKTRSSQRLPFQNVRSRATTPDILADRSVDQLKPSFTDPNAGYNLVKPKPNRAFDDKLRQLHEDYNKLMQLYRKAKQRGQSSAREQEIDHLVQKLWDVCEEAPDVFKLPPEIQDRLDELNQSKSDQQLSPLVSPSPVNRPLSDSSESLSQSARDRDSPGSLRLSQLDATPNRGISNADRRRLEDIRVGRFSPLGSDRGANPQGIRPRSGAASPMNPRQGHHRSRSGKLSPLDRNSPLSRDWSGDNLKKNYQGGSMTSLPDSGISEQSQGNATGGSTRPKLASRSGEFDTDSGFIGSVVGAPPTRPQNLLLRHRGSVDEDRLQEIDEGAVGGRDSPGLGNFQESGRSRQRRLTERVDQASDRVDFTESDVSDSDPQNRRGRSDQKPQDDAWEQSSLEDNRYENNVGMSLQKGQQQSKAKGTKANGYRSGTVSNVEPPTPKKSKIPQVYYSEDSASEEDDEEIEVFRKNSRSESPLQRPGSSERVSSRQGYYSKQRTESGSESSERPRSRQGQSTRLRTGSVSESSERPRSRQGQSARLRTESGSESSDRPRSRQGERARQKRESGSESRERSRQQQESVPGLGGRRTWTNRRANSGSRRGSHDSTLRSDSLERSSSRSDQALRSRTRPGSGDRVGKGRYYGNKQSVIPLDHNSTFSVDDESEGSVRPQSMRSTEKDTSNVTESASESSPKVHSNSSRLKALQKEIQKLKDDVKKVNEGEPREVNNVPKQPRLKYDPDNPFGFMEGQAPTYPRRRANSFSGSPARQYDDWLLFQPSLPRQHVEQQQQTPTRRGRDEFDGQRRGGRVSRDATKKSRRPFSASVYTEENDRRLLHNNNINEDDVENHPHSIYGRYGEASRRRSEIMDRQVEEGRSYRPLANGGRAYRTRTTSSEESSQPYSDGVVMETAGQPQYFIPSGYVYYPNGNDPENIQYVAQPMLSSSPVRGRSLSQGRVAEADGYSDSETDQQVPMYSLQAAVCPHCGRTSYHTHGAYVFPTQPEDGMVTTSPDVLQLRKGRRRSKSRQRSRSLSRQRYYSPDRDRNRSRYFVREFNRNQSDSEESEDERSRPRHRARYRNVSQSRSLSRSKGRRYRRSRSRSQSAILSDDSDTDSTLSAGNAPPLDASIHLASRTARDIDNLTRKMMSAVKGEITRHSRPRERRSRKSSFW